MINITKKLLTLSILSTLVYAMPTADQKFKKADVNNDGTLTSTEFYNDMSKKMELKIKQGKAMKGASSAPQFEMVDANKDGLINFKEYDKFHTIRQKEMRKIRNNNQGQGNKSKGLRVFEKYDKDGNGCIDKNEFRELYRAIR